jgi:hypothetical protein
MARTAVAVEQTIWDCRWSQPGLHVAHIAERDRRQPTWVCTRTGACRAVDEHECAQCPHWQSEDARRN